MKLCREQCEERDGQCQNRALHPDCGQRHERAALIPVLSQCCRSECLQVGMGTPASVVSSQSPSWQAPEPRARKKASANIFKDIDLLQIQTLFRTSGDDCAEERARIICEYAEDRRIAEALIQLRRKKRSKAYHQPAPKLSSDQIGTLSVQHFSKLCIHEAGHISSSSTENDSNQQSEVTQDLHPCATKNGTATWKKNKERKSQRRISEYLHQIKR